MSTNEDHIESGEKPEPWQLWKQEEAKGGSTEEIAARYIFAEVFSLLAIDDVARGIVRQIRY